MVIYRGRIRKKTLCLLKYLFQAFFRHGCLGFQEQMLVIHLESLVALLSILFYHQILRAIPPSPLRK